MIDDKILRELYELKFVIRYNCRRHIKDESVAEHSYYVALLSMMICDEKKINDEKIRLDCFTKALLHDMPEIETNDITHNAKEKMNLRKLLKLYEDDFFVRKFPLQSSLMRNDDYDSIVNAIVLLADTLSVKQFTANELQIGNADDDMKEIYEDACKRSIKAEKHLDELLKTF